MGYILEYPLIGYSLFAVFVLVSAFIYDKMALATENSRAIMLKEIRAYSDIVAKVDNKYQYFREFVPAHNIAIIDTEKRLEAIEQEVKNLNRNSASLAISPDSINPTHSLGDSR